MKSISSILAILALAVTVNAQEKKPEEGAKKKGNPEEMFKKMDKDGNGSISKEEFMASPGAKKDEAKAAERFGKMDKNSDGMLTKEEMTPKKKKDA